MLSVVKQNEEMYIAVSPPFHILGATYGPSDQTEKVVSLVKNRSLIVEAENKSLATRGKIKKKFNSHLPVRK